jgi:hypothetical protein
MSNTGVPGVTYKKTGGIRPVRVVFTGNVICAVL